VRWQVELALSSLEEYWITAVVDVRVACRYVLPATVSVEYAFIRR
jgi:hypothetical protein